MFALATCSSAGARAVARQDGDTALTSRFDLSEGIARHTDWLAGLSYPLRMSLLPAELGVSR
jgi:hypothetical protein